MKILISFLLLFCFQVSGAELQLPALTSPVMDLGNFLNESERQDLEGTIRQIHEKSGPQITILTVPDLQGYPIEEFSIRVAEKWKLGTKQKGNGLLITISKAEREMRIEVGEGIEGEITDFESNTYIREILTPNFKQGNFYLGLKEVLNAVANKFNIQTSATQFVRRAPKRHAPIKIPAAFPILVLAIIIGHLILRKHPIARGLYTGVGLGFGGFLLGLGGLIIGLFIFGFVIGLTGLSNFLFMMAQSGSHRGGGYGGGGFGGGGGWSGGGGGFSGGGSSGRW